MDTKYYISASDTINGTVLLQIVRSVGPVGKNGYARTDNDVSIWHQEVHRAKAVSALKGLRPKVDAMNEMVSS